MYEELRWACIAVFTVAIPLLVLARFRYPEFPAWLLIVFVTALGWLLPYAHMSMRGPMLRHWEREQMAAQEEYMRHPWPLVKNPDGSGTVENPFCPG